VAPQLASNLLRLRGGKITTDSAFFNFHGKLTAVVEHFAPDGLTMPDYLLAAVRQPPLFYQAPATLIANVQGVTDHFAHDGLTLREYLRAAVKQPQLFYQSPATLIGNIEGEAAHFREDGLTLPAYLR
jgi:hypothetical protein